MENIKALRQRAHDLKKEMRAMLDVAVADGNRDLNEAETAVYDGKLTPALLGVQKQITRTEELLEGERNASASEEGNNGEVKTFKTFGEQLRAVAKAYRSDGRILDSRLSASASGLSEAVPSDGGFAVQADFAQEILRRTYTMGEIMSRVRKQTVQGNGLKINAVDETSRVDGSRWGGVQAFWSNEADTVTAKKPKFRRMELTLEKLMGLYYATDELIEDAAALGGIAMDAFSEELLFKAEDAIFEGDGSGKPQGILNCAAAISVAKETSQVAATIVAENVLKMYSRLPARSKQTAVWLINTDATPQLPQLNIKVKNVAGSENVGGLLTPIYQFPNGGSALGPGNPGNPGRGTILGLPVIEVEYASTLGTLGDIVLADLSQYLLIDKGGIQSASSMHVRFLNDEMVFRLTWRLDGQPIWNSALTPFKGSNTQSPFVTLATRS